MESFVEITRSIMDVKGQVSDISLKTDKQNHGDRFLNLRINDSKTCPLDSVKKLLQNLEVIK